MDRRRVFVVGSSLFAETLASMLSRAEKVEMIGWAPTPEAALLQLRAVHPDALIIASENEPSSDLVGRLLAADPGLPLILANLNMNRMQMITSQYIGGHISDLFTAIAVLPHRQAADQGPDPLPDIGDRP
jgi:hypothetical protein